MTDVERWIDAHEVELRSIAERAGAHDDTVRVLATLVLGGLTDDEIYDHLRAMIPSPDGQHSPLVGAPELVLAVRELISAS